MADDDRTVTVSGHGEISAEPDMATVTLGVEARGSEQKATQLIHIRPVSQAAHGVLASHTNPGLGIHTSELIR